MNRYSSLKKQHYLDLICILQLKLFMYKNGMIHSMKKSSITSILNRYPGMYECAKSYVRGNSKRLVPDAPNFFRTNYPNVAGNDLTVSIYVRNELYPIFREFGIDYNQNRSYYTIQIFSNYVLNEKFLAEIKLYLEITKTYQERLDLAKAEVNNRISKKIQDARANNSEVPNLHINNPSTSRTMTLQERFNERWKKQHEEGF